MMFDAEGRDKLSKLIIYLMKLSDAIVSVYREYPTYKLEKIASTYSITKSTSKEHDSSCGWASLCSNINKHWH